MELNFNWKYKNYELRACPKHLVKFNDDDKNETIDFVKWNDDHTSCFSLAYWIKNKERYDLTIVGNRAFEYIEDEDIDIVWTHLKAAQKILDAYWGVININ